MIRIFLISLLCLPIASLGATQDDVSTPVQVAAAFQKVPHSEMFCKDESWRKSAPIKVGQKFDKYLSKEFFKLAFWSQCGQPKVPPRYNDLDNIFYWDIRYGFENGGREDMEDNVRIQPAQYKGAEKALVNVIYDFGTLNNLTTTYTLIREDGHWKIDDIAPKGDWVEEGDQEPHLQHSDSIKTDMQSNYRAAEERYQQEQAKKGAASKP